MISLDGRIPYEGRIPCMHYRFFVDSNAAHYPLYGAFRRRKAKKAMSDFGDTAGITKVLGISVIPSKKFTGITKIEVSP